MTVVWYCTCINTHTLSHVVRTDLSNSRYSPKVQCHQFTAIQNTPIPSPMATASVLFSLASEWNSIQKRGVIPSRAGEMLGKINTAELPVQYTLATWNDPYPGSAEKLVTSHAIQLVGSKCFSLPSLSHYTGHFIMYSEITIFLGNP